jgi:hypothetical protein
MCNTGSERHEIIANRKMNIMKKYLYIHESYAMISADGAVS